MNNLTGLEIIIACMMTLTAFYFYPYPSLNIVDSIFKVADFCKSVLKHNNDQEETFVEIDLRK